MNIQQNIDALEASRKLEHEAIQKLLLTEEPNIDTMAFRLGIIIGLGIAIRLAKESQVAIVQ